MNWKSIKNLSTVLLLGSLLARPGFAAVSPIVGQDAHYKVKKGDTLYTIAKKYNLALEHLAFANHLPLEVTAPVGRTLLIPSRHILPTVHPPTGLLINLPERGVYLFKDNHFVAFYPIAIGEPGFKTPLGHFKINSMVKNPTWLPPAWAGKGEVVVPAGPNNPLGDRWMGLTAPGIGLHATTEPMSVGANASHGCMRMYPELAHQLFLQVHKGMPAWIVYEPVKVGEDPKTQAPFMQVFPDVYHHNNTAHMAEKLVATDGLKSKLTAARLKQLLAHPNGIVEAFKPA